MNWTQVYEIEWAIEEFWEPLKCLYYPPVQYEKKIIEIVAFPERTKKK